jgi:hypothetical protein
MANINIKLLSEDAYLFMKTHLDEVTTKIIENEERGYLKERGMQFVDITAMDINDYPLYKEWLLSNHPSLVRGLTNQLSFYMSLSYGYKDYFTLNLNGRTDASNKFGSRSNERFLPVWSASGMWNIRKTLFDDVKWLNEARLRLSYGMQGSSCPMHGTFAQILCRYHRTR